jgi:hypothetical protein
VVALFSARVCDRMRRYIAGPLFEAARIGLSASVRAFHRGLLNKRLLHASLHLASNVHRACYPALDRPLYCRRY